MTDQYAVIGQPVAHSKSPRIHALFAARTAQDLSYVALPAPLNAFAATVETFRRQGGRGVNVTLPFKHEAWSLAHERAGYAQLATAVNTLHFVGDRIIGYNTDGVGLRIDLERNLNFSLCGRRILLLGAGGASYGVVQPLLEAHPAELVLANRTVDKALRLRDHFTAQATLAVRGLSVLTFDALYGERFDLVINATSAGISGQQLPFPDDIWADGALAYDMMYGRSTPFLESAACCGVRCADGLGMLVEQAAEAFYIWRGMRPDTAPVLAQLRAGG